MTRQKQAIFRFYAELNDFLPKAQRQKDIMYHFWGNPAVKDAIEAMGVPHPEVDLIQVNQRSVDFGYRLQNGDRVAVYPVFELLNIGPVTRLRPKPLRHLRFILDCNLGKLTRKLRMLGFDCLYQNDYDDQEIVDLAQKEKRVILTRDVGLLKNSRVTHGYWVRSTNPAKQLREVLLKFDLFNEMQPFSRCLECNGQIEIIDFEKISNQVPPRVRRSFKQFYQCLQCGKVYWRGSHYDHMRRTIQNLSKESGKNA